MKQKHYNTGLQKWKVLMYIALILPISIYSLSVSEVKAEQQLSVSVKILNMTYGGCDDGDFGGPPDIYWNVWIDDTKYQTGEIYVNLSPAPVNVEIPGVLVDYSKGTIPITIEQRDADDAFLGEDDFCDCNPDPDKKSLELVLDLKTREISGDATGYAGQILGNAQPIPIGGTIIINGPFQYIIDVVEPPYADGLSVRCLHKPLWPSPTDKVTIYLEALDRTMDCPGGNDPWGNYNRCTPNQRISDSLEIWVNDKTQPIHSDQGTGTSVKVGPFTDSSFTYNCRVQDDGLIASTGWRTVSVGDEIAEKYDGIAPVYYAGNRSISLDVILYPEKSAHSNNPKSAKFMQDAYTVIWEGLLNEDIFVINQDKFNFWLAQDLGDVQQETPGDSTSVCENVNNLPYRSWAEASVILHDTDCRDNLLKHTGKGNFATTQMNSTSFPPYRIFLHEASHALFNLSDEYDNSPAHMAWPFPNAYDSKVICERDTEDYYDYGSGVCEEDAILLSSERSPSDCRDFQTNYGKTFWTSDPKYNDLMTNNGSPQLLDIRKIEWTFCKCRKEGF